MDLKTVSRHSGKLLDSISLDNEPWLEKYARYFRFRATVQILAKQISQTSGKITLVDYGCGQDVLFYKFLKHYFPDDLSRISYVGIDPLIVPRKINGITLLRKKFEDTTGVPRADIIAMFAVLEHVDNPGILLETAYSNLKPNGCILATTPSWLAKPVLEFFSYILGIISVREIQEHKQYFSKISLSDLIVKVVKKSHDTWTHRYFELGLNNMIFIRKGQ